MWVDSNQLYQESWRTVGFKLEWLDTERDNKKRVQKEENKEKKIRS